MKGTKEKFDMQNMHVSQYLDIHPVKHKNGAFRSGYIKMLSFFSKQCGGDIWNESVLKLFIEILGGADSEGSEQPGKLKYFFWRDVLLADILFITAFDNEEKGSNVLNNFCSFYGERYRKKLSTVFDCFYGHLPLDNQRLKCAPIIEYIQSNRKFRALPEKKILITANMSAGKSTLLNALTGKRVNKTMNDACTAKVHYLYNKPYEDGYIYEYDHELELNASQEILMDDNDSNKTSKIYVGSYFRNTCGTNQKVILMDTPGVNSAMDKDHQKIASTALKTGQCDLLIYLMNGEVIATDDEAKHLAYVKENYSGNIVFLINKLDYYKEPEDSVEETIVTVRKYLAERGFETSRVYPISAYAAFLAKMEQNGEELTEDEKDDLNYLKRKLAKEHFMYNKYYEGCTEKDSKDEILSLIEHSGIEELEKIIYK
jgi:GTPase Era involved in 16S rRNA processing